MFDILIRGGSVADGTGRPAFAADVAVSGGRIAAVGDLRGASAAQGWDASGKTVTPGFIDIHRHADAALLRPGFGAAELCQGLTTIVNGNCGLSAAPFGGAHGDAIRDYLRPITGAIPPELVTDTLAGFAGVEERWADRVAGIIDPRPLEPQQSAEEVIQRIKNGLNGGEET